MIFRVFQSTIEHYLPSAPAAPSDMGELHIEFDQIAMSDTNERLIEILTQINRNLVAVGHLVRDASPSKEILENLQVMAARNAVREILRHPRYADPLRLEPYGYRVYSQNDEDGIIAEIFKRIGVTNRTFVEFGVESGKQNNTFYLLAQGWSGLWLEGAGEHVRRIRETFASQLASGQLALRHAFVTPGNINGLISDGLRIDDVKEIDLLSIDVDGTDYHIFSSIDIIKPRVVVIEYNAAFPPPFKYVMPYVENYRFDVSDSFGASLSSYEEIFRRRGYCLVGCNLTGVNAFFVRGDLVDGRFLAPFSAETHYQPFRLELVTRGFESGFPCLRPPVGSG